LQRSASDVAADTRRYCNAHPDARDTIAGITWWVHMQEQEDLATAVAQAVDLLLQEGLLERYQQLDGTEVFGCARCAE
jgi:hypothetical protein